MRGRSAQRLVGVHLVPAAPTASNLTQLRVDGDNEDVDQASPYACAALAGSAVCDPARGVYDLTWTLTNSDGAARPVLGTSPRSSSPRSLRVPVAHALLVSARNGQLSRARRAAGLPAGVAAPTRRRLPGTAPCRPDPSGPRGRP